MLILSAILSILSFLFVLTLTGHTSSSETALLEQRIRDVLQLHSAEHIYRDVIYIGEKDRFFGIPMRDRSLLFSIDIQVKAGVNIEQGFKLRRTMDPLGKPRVLITLPMAEIFSVDAREESIRQYFSSGYGNPINLISFYDQIMHSRTAIMEDAIRNGILQQAEDNARILLQDLMHDRGATYISFSSPPGTAND